MRKALEGLPGVEKIEMDLERDQFRVGYRQGVKPDAKILLGAIQDLGYAPSIVSSGEFRASAEPRHPTQGIPGLIQESLNRAKAERKLVIVDCTAEW